MLKPNVAQERLKQWKIDESDDDSYGVRESTRFEKAFKKLPAKLATIAFGLYQLDAKGKPSKKDPRKAAVKELDGLSAKERMKLWQVVFPKMPAEIERAWVAQQKGPYQDSWSKKAFRAPRHPEVSLGVRGDWISEMLGLAESFDEQVLEPVWLAAWAPYLKRGWRTWEAEIGTLLASTLDAGGKLGDDVFDILSQSVRNEHEIGSMGRHVLSAFLQSSREDGWELIEKTLLAAQRQEGLRQSILEAVDLAHPGAFRRMLRIIQEHDLARFSAVARAVNVWFGFAWDSASVKVMNDIIETALTMIDDESARTKALKGNDPNAAFHALWAEAFEDAPASIPLAAKLLKHRDAEMRFVGLTHLGHLALPEANAMRWTASDDDLRVALRSIGTITTPGIGEDDDGEQSGDPTDDAFERLERLHPRLPEKSVELKPIVWPWTTAKVSQETTADALLDALGKRPPTRMLPYVSKLSSWRRCGLVELFAKQKKWDAATRAAVVDLAGNASADVRTAAMAALKKIKLIDAEIEQLLGTLTRKAADLRTGVMELVMQQSDAKALASADSLLSSKDANQRLAGLELLRQLHEGSRSSDECQQRAAGYRELRKKVNKDEERQLAAIQTVKSSAGLLTLDNALGLMDPTKRTPVVTPRNLKTKIITPAAIACLKELDDLVHKHRETPIRTNQRSNETKLLGTTTWDFPSPNWSKKPELEAKELPLRDVWEAWFSERSAKTRDADGLEILRLRCWSEYAYDWNYGDWNKWVKRAPHRKAMVAPLDAERPIKLRYQQVVNRLVEWMSFLHRADGQNEFLLDAAETLCAVVPIQELKSLIPKPDGDDEDDKEDTPWYGDSWRDSSEWKTWLDQSTSRQSRLTDAEEQRHWQLSHWLDCPLPNVQRCRPDDGVLRKAYSVGAANIHDFADALVGPDCKFDVLEELSRRRLSSEWQNFVNQHPEICELVDRARVVILESELHRGEAPTAATLPALNLGELRGTATLVRLMQSLGKSGFKLVTGWREGLREQRPQTLTHLASVTYAAEGETPELFVELMQAEIAAKSFPEERLIELAFLAPQWTKCVEAYFQWDGLSEGLYWFLAHMRFMWGSDVGDQAAESAGVAGDSDDDQSAVSDDLDEASESEDDAEPKPEKLSAWERLIRERTALTAQERTDGAIDVIWFRRVYAVLGAERWQMLAQASKFASNAAQSKKAQLLADVLLGQAKLDDLIAGIEKKFLKENVRLLGLYPLPTGAKCEPELARRFKVLQEYGRYAKTLSGLTKPEALRSLEIGLKNLASTAGYADALRLDWALGASQWADLRKGPVSETKDGVTVTLSLDEQVKPVFVVARGDKELKSAPPAVKKHAPIAELYERARDLKRQASRQKQALEAAMCRGDQFSASELQQLCQHALVAPFLERLVLVGDGVLGYADKGGKALRNHAGKLEPVKKNELLRIAHPHDLLASGDWAKWQHDCFSAERVQPFKQVFRELYVLTKAEKTSGDRSLRYAVQQVQPKQAMALWGSRGWQTGDGVFKVFHHAGIVAGVSFHSGAFTPLEVEGLTLEAVSFTQRNDYRAMKLTDVEPRLFSEVMRDMDLVVSVAHRGGVDPEATASTVEMRSALIRETCQLLGLKNVRLKGSHALVDGTLANYSIHLGSGTVHRMPGGSLCVVPVHAQHRGRLFLPFADDDPRTAEVLSKILLFARDQEIQDPGILEQLRS